MLSKDIEKLDAGSWFSSRFIGIHVPRIAEMLDTLQGKAHIFFDVKRGTPIKDLITLVRQKGYENKKFLLVCRLRNAERIYQNRSGNED